MGEVAVDRISEPLHVPVTLLSIHKPELTNRSNWAPVTLE